MALTGWLLAGAAGWLVIGVVLALVLGRRGHDRFAWFLLGSSMGPVALPLAWRARTTGEDVPPARVGPAEHPGQGTIDVVVGWDGSVDARRALEAATTLFGGQLRRLNLAEVVPYDCGPAAETEARAELRAALHGLRSPLTGAVLLHGEPSQALLDHARSTGAHVLVCGARGRGGTQRFGSTAQALTRNAALPVLLVGPPEEEATRSTDAARAA